jgi:hypothetical protein
VADIAQLEDEALRRLREELERQVARHEAELRRRLGGLSDASEREKAALIRAVAEDMAAILDGLRSKAQDGFREVSAAVLDAIGDDLAETYGAQLTAAPLGVLRAAVDGTVDDIATIAGEANEELRRLLLDSSLSTLNPSEALDALVGKMNATVSRSISLADTALMGLDRQVQSALADDLGLDWMGLDHPEDQLTRPWCREHGNYRYTQAQIDALRNDTGPQPPRIYCGGWQCRGRWIALTEEMLSLYPPWPG